jgi:O-antigen ligase
MVRAIGSRTRGGPRPAFSASAIAVTAWVLAALISTLVHPPLRFGLFGEIEQREGFLTVLGLAGLFAGARASHTSAAQVRTTLAVMIVCSALAGAYALIQFAGHDPLAWANASLYASVGEVVVRPWGTLGNAILLGALASAALAAAIGLLAADDVDPWRYAPLIALLGVAVVITLSRGAWLAAVAGAGVALLGARTIPAAGRRRRILVSIAAAAIPAAVFAGIALRGSIAARLAESVPGELGSSGARAEIARGALGLWRTQPWLGTGPDGFGLMFPRVQSAALWRQEWLGQPVHAHSAALQTLATLGLIGALAGLAWLLATFVELVREGRRTPERRAELLAIGAALAALIAGGAFNVIGLAAAACFAVLSALIVRGVETPRTAGFSAAAAAGLTVASVFGTLSLEEMRALHFAGDARSALLDSTRQPANRTGLFAQASLSARQATHQAPGEDELWRIACDADAARAADAIARGDLAAAQEAANSAHAAALRTTALMPARASNVERVGNAFVVRALVTRAAAGDGAPEVAALASAADSAYEDALRLAPTNGLIMMEQARAALMFGRPERALEIARQITALYPAEGTGHAAEAAALLTLGRHGAAAAALRRALAGHWDESASERGSLAAMLAAIERGDTLAAGAPDATASPPASR